MSKRKFRPKNSGCSDNLALLRERSRDLYAGGGPLGRGAIDRLVSLCFKSVLLNGEALVMLPMRYTKNFPYDLRIPLIEGDRLQDPTIRPYGAMIDCKPVACHKYVRSANTEAVPRTGNRDAQAARGQLDSVKEEIMRTEAGSITKESEGEINVQDITLVAMAGDKLIDWARARESDLDDGF